MIYRDEFINRRTYKRCAWLKCHCCIEVRRADIPYIVYGGLSIQPDYTKDGAGQDNTQVQVTVVGKGAGETVEMANEVRYELEGVRAEYARFTVNDCTVSSIDVEYLQEIDAYAVNIVFNFKTNDK